MSEHTKVSAHIDHCTTSAEAAQGGPLSRAGVLLCCPACSRLFLRPAQFQCPLCHIWKAARHKHGTRCSDCHNQQQRHPADAAAAAPAPPDPLFPPHAGSHAPLPLIQRAAVVMLHKQGLPRGAIAQQAGISLPSVRRWVQRFEKHGSLADEPRRGRPRCTDEAMDTAIVGAAYVEKFCTPRGLKRKYQFEPSARTIDRRLQEVNLFGRVARHKKKLTDEEKRARLSFAEGYMHMTADDWMKIMFADEKKFKGEGFMGQVWVRRPKGEADNPDYQRARSCLIQSSSTYGAASAAADSATATSSTRTWTASC